MICEKECVQASTVQELFQQVGQKELQGTMSHRIGTSARDARYMVSVETANKCSTVPYPSERNEQELSPMASSRLDDQVQMQLMGVGDESRRPQSVIETESKEWLLVGQARRDSGLQAAPRHGTAGL